MNESILTSVKKQLGVVEDYTHFDDILVTYINMVFSTLFQIGVGPKEGFSITGSNENWGSYTIDQKLLNFLKPYIYTKVRLLFDPPSGALLDALKQQSAELEWRLNVMVDPKTESNEGVY